MAASEPLTGTDLIDCAKANANQGIETAAKQCGYGDDLSRFQTALKQACHDIGIEISELSDLITDQDNVINKGGVKVAPDTPSSL
ncbi:hypothetical protein [Oscillatoria salina]|uniref:hypothetical protein n=1 Tax=Oscillatoria salina TaxID=331517 RepID=UPI0013B7697F|nr:hypothetical protein [Oscillatoria salina]MBZ8182651.1 hypothetical protein [Oscillatoria salina IIICB1]NET89885.1 hypothetical protein [Kamptonema sp. SIO1D9]